MTTNEVKKKYLDFFTVSPRSHKVIEPALLIPENDTTTLFTSSGMQQLVPYLTGKLHPEGKRLVDSQPSLRLQDINEVGDNRHNTFFEMLGNWSLGDYFKSEQLPWLWEFLTVELSINSKRLHVSVFEGNKEVPKDEESVEIWKKLGVPSKRIHFYGVEKNWWSRSGPPKNMPTGEIGGPDSEVFYDFGEDLKLHEKSAFKSEKCHPNCDCGRFLEIGNSVFIQYKKEKDGSLSELSQRNVDFGGGLERQVAAVTDNPDIYAIDVFKPVVEKLSELSGKKYLGKDATKMRIIADHLRASVVLISEGLKPGNKLQSYILRRLIRRSVYQMKLLGLDINKELPKIVNCLLKVSSITDLKDLDIGLVIRTEADNFITTLNKGVRYLESQEIIDATVAFNSLTTYGIPFDVTREIARKRGQKIDKEDFEKNLKEHKEKSRTASAGMFRGGLAGVGEETTKLHTATHLLHAALRNVLGTHVSQKGSNITQDRLRFDFSHKEKLTDEQIKRLENMVNEKIKDDLPVTSKIMSTRAALDSGALANFAEKYGEKVKVYSIGDSSGTAFSREVCGGPHVRSTGKIGRVKIIKQKKIGMGLVRIYAQI